MARPPRRVPPVRTVGLESLDDLQAFRDALGKRLTLPRIRIALRLPGLATPQRESFERHINRLLAARGWVEASACALVLLILAAAFPLSPAGGESGEAWAAWAAQALLFGATGAALGALLGRARAKWRLGQTCRALAQQAAPAPVTAVVPPGAAGSPAERR